MNQNNLNNLLLQKIKEGNLPAVKNLIHQGACLNNQGGIHLITACQKGYTAIVEYLLEKNADPTENNSLCLIRALENGHLDIVKILINHGANPKTLDNFPILLALNLMMFQKYSQKSIKPLPKPYSEITKYLLNFYNLDELLELKKLHPNETNTSLINEAIIKEKKNY